MENFTHTLRAGIPKAPPLFCIHPVSGDARALTELASRSRSAGSWIGIDDPGLHGAPLAATLAERADMYADAIALRANGPVHLFGWSTGGAIAAEVSERFASRGIEVGRLLIVDTRVPQAEMRNRDVSPERLRTLFVEASARWANKEDQRTGGLADIPAVADALARLGLYKGATHEQLAQRLAVFGANLRSYFNHQAQPISTQVTLFETEDEHPDHPRPSTLGWEDIASNIVRRSTPGTHFTAVFAEHAHALASAVDELLEA